MGNDAFVAFWVGTLVGLIVGIILSSVFVAVSNRIEGSNENEKD